MNVWVIQKQMLITRFSRLSKKHKYVDSIVTRSFMRMRRVLTSFVILQIGKGTRGDVTILPTLVINNRQYRGV